ncbi:MAG: hypothetical protein ACK5NC_11475 [Vibrio sp.]
MQGKIVYINQKRGIFAVQLENGFFSVCENISSCNLEVGQQVKGPLDSGGRETLYNIDESELFEVSVESPEVTEQGARQALSQFR